MTVFDDALGPQIAAHPSDPLIATGGEGVVQLWREGVQVDELRPPAPWRGAIRFSTAGAELYCGPQRLDLPSRDWRQIETMPELEGVELAWSARGGDGDVLLLTTSYRPPRRGTGTPTGPTRRVVIGGGRALHEDSGYADYTTLLVQDRWLLAAHLNVLVWDRRDLEPLATLSEGSSAVRVLATNADDSLLASIAADGRVALWNTMGWHLEATWQAHPGDAHGLAFHPTEPSVATGGHDGLAKTWSIDGTLAGEHVFERPIGGLAYTSSGELAVVAMPPARGGSVLR